MKKLSSIPIKVIYIFSNLGAWLGIFCLFSLSAMIVVGTLGRYFFNKPILGVDEISGYLNALIGFLTLAYTLQEERHVRVDIVAKRLSHKVRSTLEIVTSTLALMLIGQFLRTGWYSWMLLIQSNEHAQTYLRTPLAVPYGFMMLGWVLLFLVILVHLAKEIKGMRDNRNKRWREDSKKLNRPMGNE